MSGVNNDELWDKIRKIYNANTNLEAMIEIEKKFPGIFWKSFQVALHPKIIYQYTSIQALTMILSTRKLKLNSLKNVDDKVEGVTNDIGDMKKYFFASCWTSESDESIPMWEMYGDLL